MTPTSAPIADLIAAIDRLGQHSTAEQSPKDTESELVQLRHACDLLELRFAALARRFAATDAADQADPLSAIDWIRHECRMSRSAAAASVCVGERLEQLPDSVQAVADGAIGFAHLVLIARTLEALSHSSTAVPATTDPPTETQLLRQAMGSSVGRFWHLCYKARHAADPEGVAEEQRRATEERTLRLSPCDGGLTVGGWLDPIGGAALRTALEPLARPAGEGDDRGRERRLADALVELATHALDTGQLPQQANVRPHLQVTSTVETLLAFAGSSAADMEYSLPVSTKTVERLACDSTLTRVLLGSDSVVIDVGRAQRVVCASTRRALNARDGQCQWPGCDRPSSWSAAHHLVHWTNGGETNLSNLILVCHRHHWMAHEGGWQLVRTNEGRFMAIPPRTFLPSARAPDRVLAA